LSGNSAGNRRYQIDLHQIEKQQFINTWLEPGDIAASSRSSRFHGFYATIWVVE
jgi:hypothetical protein